MVSNISKNFWEWRYKAQKLHCGLKFDLINVYCIYRESKPFKNQHYGWGWPMTCWSAKFEKFQQERKNLFFSKKNSASLFRLFRFQPLAATRIRFRAKLEKNVAVTEIFSNRWNIFFPAEIRNSSKSLKSFRIKNFFCWFG